MSTVQDAEERYRDTISSLPIKTIPREKAGTKKKPATGKKVTVYDIIRSVMPDVHARFTKEVESQALAEAARVGKKTTAGSLSQAVYQLRKEDAPAAGAGRKKRAAESKPVRAKAAREIKGETFQDLIIKLEACMENIINERDELREFKARITDAVK